MLESRFEQLKSQLAGAGQRSRGFGLVSAMRTNVNNTAGSGSQQLVMPQRVVVEATIHNHVELEGREILTYVNKKLLDNSQVYI